MGVSEFDAFRDQLLRLLALADEGNLTAAERDGYTKRSRCGAATGSAKSKTRQSRTSDADWFGNSRKLTPAKWKNSRRSRSRGSLSLMSTGRRLRLLVLDDLERGCWRLRSHDRTPPLVRQGCMT